MSDIAGSVNSTNSFEFTSLHWDTKYFKVKSAKAVLNKKVSDAEGNRLARLSSEFDFITIVNKNNDPINNLWIANNTTSFLTDMNIQFIKNKKDFIKKLCNGNLKVINCLPRNEEIYQIAFSSFLYSRFFNDPNLNTTKTEALYANWVLNSFGKDDKHFIIAESNHKVSGFLLFSIDRISSSCVIELIAVDKLYAGRRIGKQLITKLENYVINLEVENIKVGTQVNNITASNFYTACGFKYTECASIYHYWPKI